MKLNRIANSLALLTLLGGLSVVPAYGANKDFIELQTEVTQLQQQMTQMKQSFDERMGVMRNMLEQNTDVTNKAISAINNLQASINKQQDDRSGQGDQLSGQIQSLNDTMDELKVRLDQTKQATGRHADGAAVDGAAADLKRSSKPSKLSHRRLLPTFSTTMPCVITTAARTIWPCRNSATTLSFIRTRISRVIRISIWPRFQYKAGDFQEGSRELRFSPAKFSQRKQSGSCRIEEGILRFLEMGKEDEGAQALKRVIQRYPRTNEATQARERLRKAGAAPRTSRQ